MGAAPDRSGDAGSPSATRGVRGGSDDGQDDPVEFHRRGRRLAGEGRLDEAVALLARAARARPTEAQWHADHARACVRAGDLEGAAAAYRTALEVDADPPQWHHRLARTLERLDDLDGARDAYRAALERDPTEPTWHAQLGWVLERLDDGTGAAAAYQGAVDRDRTVASWHARLGHVRKRMGDWAGAAVAYRDAVLREGDRPDWHVQVGHALERSGDWAGATLAYRRADAVAAEQGVDQAPTRRLPLERRAYLGLVRKPQYAFGLLRAASLAAKLDIARISAVELGVAGGNGLVALEHHADEVAEVTGVAVDVIGFDTGEGLFAPADHRDMPYMFAAGNYAIDVPKLEARLRSARLVIGDAVTTFADFLAEDPAPIGFLAFDMDVYSATSGVLAHLGDTAPAAVTVPRANVYFDDVYGHQGQDYNPFAGELLAIDEFNDRNDDVKLAEDRTFRTLPVNAPWHHGMYVMHRFAHPRYGTYVGPADATSLRLRDEG